MVSTVDNPRTARVPDLGQEYNAFLYATIGVDANGSAVSVLSAMARLNLDPWQESKALAQLSTSAAARRLASLIAAVPGGPSSRDEAARGIDRLVKLLPARTSALLPVIEPRKFLPNVEILAQPRTALYVLFALIALFLVVRWFGANQALPSPQQAGTVSQTAQPAGDSAGTRRR
jgi:hypothetical protein